MQNIKAVIFDIDNTLVDRREAFLRLCDYLIETYGKDYPFEITREELVRYLVEIDANGYGGLEKFVPKLSGVWKLPHTIEEFVKERNEVFGKLTVPYPDTFTVLEALKGRYKLGVITNGFSSVQREKIVKVEIEHYFDDIIVSGEEEFEKPDPRIFRLSCKHLGVSPEEAVYIGDYYPNDIAGALASGITPIWINEDDTDHPEYNGIRVKELKEVLEYL
jgi:putative hydrolase of the HAD superfamily